MVLRWLLPTALIVLAINLPLSLLRFQTYSQQRAPAPELSSSFYFYNEITGEVQWQDPGDTPYEVRRASNPGDEASASGHAAG